MDSTHRFSSRVEDYRKYRPGYPAQLVADLEADGLLKQSALIADVGSGTGLLARPFLERGHRVIGIEPNAEMRAAGDEELRAYPGFTSLAGTAEATTLAPASVDFVMAGQAFHWFDRARSKVEFRRILRPGGGCALIWNDRETENTPFLIAYEQLLQDFATDYAAVDHKQITSDLLAAFFAPAPMLSRAYPNHQTFDFESLKGRLLSSSYAPPANDPRHQPMLGRLAEIFNQYNQKGQVSFDYETKVYSGPICF